MLAPGSLYLFATPDALEGGQAWADGGASGRRFSSGFCADLLADLGASRVVCLDAAQAAGAAAFAAFAAAVAGGEPAANPKAFAQDTGPARDLKARILPYFVSRASIPGW